MVTTVRSKSKTMLGLAALCCALQAGHSHAKATPEELAQLGKTLTLCGAEVAGNADGSIPAYDPAKAVRGVPAGVNWEGDGKPLPNPYADEKPLYVIDHSNYKQYAEFLGEGTRALFEKYETFKMPVYPTHRELSYEQKWYDLCQYNAANTEMRGGIEGLQKYSGSVPFPVPHNGAEVIWNGRVSSPAPVATGTYDDVAVFSSGEHSLRTSLFIQDSPFYDPNMKVGTHLEELGAIAALVFVEQLAPERQKGQLVLVHEPIDYSQYTREAWVYVPGTRRVRKAPTVGYDTPDGPGGLMTIDDWLGFNGGMDRYDWKLVGKKEMIVPFHNYKFDDPTAKYKDMLPKYHANPDYVRYEKRRVWVVEANLKDSARHIYKKRTFYVEGDSWLIVASDSYDGRGELWRTSLITSLYHYGVQGYTSRALMFHDLRASHYVVAKLVNEQPGPWKYKGERKGKDFFSPDTLRAKATR